MKLSKLTVKLPPSLTRLLTLRPKVLPAGDEPELGGEVPARSILAALEIQSSPIFRLPEEIFLEIFAYFPALEWSDLYYCYSYGWNTPIPDVYGERIKALSALSVTCRAMRYRFLPEVWERSLMCLKGWTRSRQIPARLQLQCRTLLNDRRLAAYVKTMTVHLACDGTGAMLRTFARCLVVLPNLHTLEVVSMGTDYSQPLRKALRGLKLPQIRTLILPSTAHHILRHCPNVDNLTCTPFRPDGEFVESLTMGQQKLRRFAVLFTGDVTVWAELARVCPDIHELSVVFRDSVPGDTRNCITPLSNLSTLQIIYLVPYHDVAPVCTMGLSPCRCTYMEKVGKESEARWNEMKEMAIEHLKSCSGTGPKVLRTVVLDHDRMSGTHFDSVARTEEIQVWK